MLAAQEQAFSISRGGGLFSTTALFQQVFIVPWKNTEICIVKLYLEIVDFNKTKGATTSIFLVF